MRLLLPILFSFLIPLKGLSQTADREDSVWTFTVEPDPFKDFCNANSGKAFKILSSNYTLSIGTIFISVNNLLSNSYRYGTRFTIKGRITLKKEWVYGCGSSRWEETRIYIDPTYLYRHLKISDLTL